ncbi:YopJ/AvrA family T3SS effector serine/threonine acetyltransferase [Bartonella phoceensis]|uniref:YopJ/AvrA family T3SS effector serine/threonine acetyltransferase n=1 Tax=Bartonella phoceensis TaxID=270249 RepID=UPI001ABAE575|nr:YopJ/AvrA family T3SS effector serine/threonine acetyltransferase [Bartonella phoceensis]
MPKSKDKAEQKYNSLEELPLEDLLARLEAIPPEEKKSPLYSDKSLKSIVSDLEKDIASGDFTRTNYVYTDLTMMPALVAKANSQDAGLNLHLARSSEELVLSLKEIIEKKQEAARVMVCMERPEPHFAVIDYRDFSGRQSMLFFETTSFRNTAAQTLAAMSKSAIESAEIPGCHFSMVEMSIQKGPSEVGIVSLALAHKLYLAYPQLIRMHIDNIQGELCPKGGPLSPSKVDSYLPVGFYKHANHEERIRQYVERNPKALHEPVNKKKESILERHYKNLTLVEGKEHSVSAMQKRVHAYKSLTQ